MDPNLFHLDWERLFQVLITIVIMAFLLERGLALLFESRVFINHAQGKSFKELIAFVVAALVCWFWDFDALSMVFLKSKVTIYGAVITGAIVAGGSKASIKLFRDIMGFKSTAEAARQAAKKAGKEEKKQKGEEQK